MASETKIVANEAVMASNTREDTPICKQCSGFYSDPRMLPCLHSFCVKCLQMLIESEGYSDGTLKCPTCNAANDIPSTGVTGFCKNIRLAHSVEVGKYHQKVAEGKSVPCERCVKRPSVQQSVAFCASCCLFLCRLCKEDHEWWRETTNHEVIELEQAKKGQMEFDIPQKPMFCMLHPEKKVKYYCETCSVLVCRECVDLVHNNIEQHKKISITEVVEKERQDLKESLNGTEKALYELQAALNQGEKRIQQVNSAKKRALKIVDTTFNQIRKMVDERRELLLGQCEEIAEKKLDVLSRQMQHFQMLHERITSARDLTKDVVDNYKAEELLSIKKIIRDQILKSIAIFNSLYLEPDEDDDIVTQQLQANALFKAISEFGRVSVMLDSRRLVPSEGFAVPHAIVGSEKRLAFAVQDMTQPNVHHKPSVQAFLQHVDSEQNPMKVKVRVDKVKDGKVPLLLTPQHPGAHLLHIRVKGNMVPPFPIWVQEKRDYTSLSVQQTFNVGNTTFGVAVHPKGEVFASNYNNHYIQVFNSAGSPTHRIGSSGSGNGQLRNPWGLALVGEVLYVVENSNHRIHKFTITGDYVGKFGSNGSANGQFSCPQGICADNMGHILVADQSNKRVQVFNTHDDSFAYSITCSNYPYDVAVDNNGNIHVALYNNNHIQVFSPDGQRPLETYNGDGKLNRPSGIAIGAFGHKFIVQCNNNYLHILSPTNAQIKYYTGLSNPYAVTIDSQGYLYIADSGNFRILKY